MIFLASSFGFADVQTHYTLKEEFLGSEFFDHFQFETLDDPTNGYVDYINRETATSQGLARWDAQRNAAILAVDSTNIASGRGRASVRLRSLSQFTNGLFIIDVAHMPVGNGTWPAFWSVGPTWPEYGEIDVIEGISDQMTNFSTLHTRSSCSMESVNSIQFMTGNYNASRDCNSNNAMFGCSVEGARDSFGHGFNRDGGGVYAYEWTDSQISVWFWPRQNIPVNISSGATPDPRQWGLPVAYFLLGAECSADHFSQHQLILNTTLCGDWAGNSFNGLTGIGSDACRHFVQSYPDAFRDAYWAINHIRAYATQ